ncbi:hypothetical protein F2Q68_00032729 [Brassica cretica]|uniref:Uncharacterized protein n=1 Tax=Brassica cretica TaxID=69181 RepID=A0A8S9GH21_BRACR|nr:hypothetical protein F2Q68_00032729 [Brassica cretica]
MNTTARLEFEHDNVNRMRRWRWSGNRRRRRSLRQKHLWWLRRDERGRRSKIEMKEVAISTLIDDMPGANCASFKNHVGDLSSKDKHTPGANDGTCELADAVKTT